MPERRKMKSPSPKMTSTPKMKRKEMDTESTEELQKRLGFSDNLAQRKGKKSIDGLRLKRFKIFTLNLQFYWFLDFKFLSSDWDSDLKLKHHHLKVQIRSMLRPLGCRNIPKSVTQVTYMGVYSSLLSFKTVPLHWLITKI